jgi:predicted alpha/beta hydrolase family esterase
VGDAPGHPEPARVLARRRAVPRLTRSFLILHGLEGSGPDHWQTWLAAQLRARGERVAYPDLSDPFDPQPDRWLAELRAELAVMVGQRVVLCHSLGCLLWLLHAREGGDAVERVLLVAPPCTDELPAVVRFRPDGVTADQVRAAAGSTRMLCSDADPYCPAGAAARFGEPLELDYAVVAGGGHLNTDAGYGPWPAVEEWALSH